MLLLLACEEVVTVRRSWPPLESARSGLLVVQRTEPAFGPVVVAAAIEEVRAMVYDAPLEAPAPPFDLTLVLYDQSLTELGFLEGSVPLADDTGRSRAFPSGGRWFQGGTAAAAEWSSLSGPGPALQRLALAEQRPIEALCPPVSIVRVDLGTVAEVGFPSFGLVLKDGRALVGAGPDRFFLLEGSGATPLTLTTTVGLITGGYQAADGELWLMGPPGNLYRGTLEGGFRKTLTTNDPDSSRWSIAGPTGADPLELFVLGSLRSFYRFDGRAFAMLRPPTRFTLNWEGAPIWVAPEVGLGVGPALRSVVRYDHGSVTENPVPLIGDDELRAGGRFPRFGTVLATARGFVFQSTDDESWTLLGGENIGFSVRAMAPWGDRLFLAGEGGLLTTYLPDFGVCEAQATGIGRVNRAIPWGELILVIPDLSNESTLSQVVLVGLADSR